MPTSVDPNMVSAYTSFAMAEHDTPEYEEYFWVFDRVCDMRRDAEWMWAFILAVLATEPPGRVLAQLAAGPLEELLVDHGVTMIERVEAEARVNPRFAWLLGGVWQNAMPHAVWRRVQTAASERW